MDHRDHSVTTRNNSVPPKTTLSHSVPGRPHQRQLFATRDLPGLCGPLWTTRNHAEPTGITIYHQGPLWTTLVITDHSAPPETTLDCRDHSGPQEPFWATRGSSGPPDTTYGQGPFNTTRKHSGRRRLLWATTENSSPPEITLNQREHPGPQGTILLQHKPV